MRRWMNVLASRLHQRTVVCRDTLIRQATLFPFFDEAGQVEHVLIVDADSSELSTFRLDATRVTIPIWEHVRLDGPVSRLSEVILDQLAPLWHFDPWWLLRDSRFESHSAVPILKLTNCAEAFDRSPVDVLFSGSLGQLRVVRFRRPTEEYASQRFRADMLPARECPPDEVSDRGGWQLAPAWLPSQSWPEPGS